MTSQVLDSVELALARICNFVIIAHIDHGKSERERGITIKAQTVRRTER